MTTYRPTSDISTTGWLPSTGLSAYATVDELLADDADYITSPALDIGAPIIMGLGSTLVAGTYYISIRLKTNSTLGGNAKISLVNDSNVVQGTSAWQAITSSYNTFNIPITTSGNSTRVKVEVVGPITVSPPVVMNSTITSNGNNLIITFSSAVSFGAGGTVGLVISMSGGALTATYSSGAGTGVLVYNLSRTIGNTETGTLAYTQPGNGIEGYVDGADVATFSNKTIANNSTQITGAPVITPLIRINAASPINTQPRMHLNSMGEELYTDQMSFPYTGARPGVPEGISIDGSTTRLGIFNINGIDYIRFAVASSDPVSSASGRRTDADWNLFKRWGIGENYWWATTLRIPAFVRNRSTGSNGNYCVVLDTHSNNNSQIQIALRGWEYPYQQVRFEITASEVNQNYDISQYIIADTDHKIVMNVVTDDTGTHGGFVKLWIDGNLIVTHTGKNVNSGDSYFFQKIACYDSAYAGVAGMAGYAWYIRDSFIVGDAGYNEYQIRNTLLSGTNIVVNTILSTITCSNGESAGVIFSGLTYPLTLGTWTVNGITVTPTSRQFDFYKNEAYYASNISPSFTVDGNYAINDVFKFKETVVINGQSYSSDYALAIAYTVANMAGGDTIAPIMNGALVASNITQTTYTLTWQTGSDNVGITGYEYSINNGSSYIDAGNVLTVNVTGRTAGTSDNCRVRAYDAAGNRSSYLSAVVTLQSSGGGGGGTLPNANSAISGQIPFSSYPTGVTVQCLGNYPSLYTVDEVNGIAPSNMGTVLGSAMRFGKVNDPLGVLGVNGQVRKVLRHAIKSSDPSTASGSGVSDDPNMYPDSRSGRVERVDIVTPSIISTVNNTYYWVAWEIYIPQNSWDATDDTTYVNLHPGSTGASWGQAMNHGIPYIAYSTYNNSQNLYMQLGSPVAPNTWLKFVHKFAMSNNSMQNALWVNGTLMYDVNHASGTDSGFYLKGPVHYNYSWGGGYGDNSRPEREVLYASVLSCVADSSLSGTDSQKAATMLARLV